MTTGLALFLLGYFLAVVARPEPEDEPELPEIDPLSDEGRRQYWQEQRDQANWL